MSEISDKIVIFLFSLNKGVIYSKIYLRCKMAKDHKELGRELGLFSFSRKVPGTVYWWPKGTILFDLIVKDLKTRLTEQGYADLRTPAIIDLETLKKRTKEIFDKLRDEIES